jgi:hypothetical protein
MVSRSLSPQHPALPPEQEARAPELNALPTAAESVEMPLPSSPQTFFLGSLLALAVLGPDA